MNFRRWICDACGFIYDEAKGDPDSGLAPGTRYDDIPDDWQCPLCGLSKSDLRLLPETPAATAPATPRAAYRSGTADKCRGGDDYVVIVGAGVAGWSVAEAIRAHDSGTPLLLITGCEGAVYGKPGLSTALAQGKQPDDLVEQDAASRARELNMQVRTRTRVIKIDTRRKRVTTSKGGIQYGKLVLALGARQRELPVSGDAAGQVLRVNDLASYRTLRKQLDANVRHVTILGAGLIGCEFADDLSSAGYAVSVVDPGPRALAQLLPDKIARRLQSRMGAKGIDWRFEATLQSLDAGTPRLRATLSDGEVLETDLVLSAAGLLPNTDLAQKAGLALEGGIRVDGHMRTSAPDVYALGDCAAVQGQVYAYIEPIRRQAQTIAANILGHDAAFEQRPPLVRIKTPSLPLLVCNPVLADGAQWQEQSDDSDGCEMVWSDEHGPRGFALCGDLIQRGSELYRQM